MTDRPIALVIDTSSAAVTAGVVAVSPDGSVEVLGEAVAVDARAHAELLSGRVRAALSDAGATFDAIAAVVVGVGPGPYTGLRVGVASGAAFADALGVASYGVVSLDAIGRAAAATGLPGCGDVLVAADARRREVYWARYRDGRRIGDPSVAKPADLRAALEPDPPAAAAGAGAALYAQALGVRAADSGEGGEGDADDGAGIPLLEAPYPRVDALAELAAQRILARAPGEVLQPLYLRRPDAEAPTSIKSVLPPDPTTATAPSPVA